MISTANNIFVSTGAFPNKELSDILKQASEINGLTGIEVSANISYSEQLSPILRQTVTLKNIQLLLHNYFPPPPKPFVLNLSSIDKNILDKSIKLCKKAIDLTAEIGAPFYSVHSGFAVDPDPKDLGSRVTHLPHFCLKKANNIFLESIENLADFAESKGVKLLLENNPMDERNLIDKSNKLFLFCGINDFHKFRNDITHENVGFLIDVGHLKVSSINLNFNKYEAIDLVADKICAFHLHDNNGSSDLHLPFKQDAWFFDFLKQYNGKAKFIIESYRLSLETIEEQIALLASKLQ